MSSLHYCKLNLEEKELKKKKKELMTRCAVHSRFCGVASVLRQCNVSDRGLRFCSYRERWLPHFWFVGNKSGLWITLHSSSTCVSWIRFPTGLLEVVIESWVYPQVFVTLFFFSLQIFLRSFVSWSPANWGFKYGTIDCEFVSKYWLVFV